MNIGLVSNLYPPYARGGAEQIVRRTAHALDRMGHRVFILTTRPFAGWKSMRQPTVERLVGTVYRFYPPNLYHPLNDWHWPWPARAVWHLTDMWSRRPAQVLREIIAREKPDAIITHNLKGVGLQVAREIRRHNLFHIHTLHDVQLSVPSGLLMAGQDQGWMNYSPLRLWYEQQVKGIVGSPHVVISPSKFLADFFRLPFLTLEDDEELDDAACDLISESVARRYGVLVTRKTDDCVTVAMADPASVDMVVSALGAITSPVDWTETAGRRRGGTRRAACPTPWSPASAAGRTPSACSIPSSTTPR